MIPTISFLYAFIIIVVVWILLFFNIENDFYNYIFIFIVIVPGKHQISSLECFLKYHVTVKTQVMTAKNSALPKQE